MPAVVILRIKDPGPHSAELLRHIERELHVMAIPQTAGYVPVAMDDLDPAAAYDAVKAVLDGVDPQWAEHLELRA
jgi:DNA-binding NarL/FixJ family response regulator